MNKLETHSFEETVEVGLKLGNVLKPGDVIWLSGDLGTGKTAFTNGIAKALGIDAYITSPTFNLVNEYEGRLPLYHFDVYRVNDTDEIEAIGFDEYIFGNGVCVIEWANYIKSLIPKEHMEINIEKISEIGVDCRKINISYADKRYSYMREIKL